MPHSEILERFIALVEENAHVEAIGLFYTIDATMQENQSLPRVGRDALVANERRALARAKSVASHCVRPVFVNGDPVVIRWIFEFVGTMARSPVSRSSPINAGTASQRRLFSMTRRNSNQCPRKLDCL